MIAAVHVANSGMLVRLSTKSSFVMILDAKATCMAAAISGKKNTLNTWLL